MEFKECLKPTKIKSLILLIELVIYCIALFILQFSYSKSTLIDYIFKGILFQENILQKDLNLTILISIGFIACAYVINSIVHFGYSYYKQNNKIMNPIIITAIKLTKIKIILLILYFILFLFYMTIISYQGEAYGDFTCQNEKGCMHPYVSYWEFMISGSFRRFSFFNNLNIFFIITTPFLISTYLLNSIVHFTYLWSRKVYVKKN